MTEAEIEWLPRLKEAIHNHRTGVAGIIPTLNYPVKHWYLSAREAVLGESLKVLLGSSEVLEVTLCTVNTEVGLAANLAGLYETLPSTTDIEVEEVVTVGGTKLESLNTLSHFGPFSKESEKHGQ
jgi:hypothetical protein